MCRWRHLPFDLTSMPCRFSLFSKHTYFSLSSWSRRVTKCIFANIQSQLCRNKWGYNHISSTNIHLCTPLTLYIVKQQEGETGLLVPLLWFLHSCCSLDTREQQYYRTKNKNKTIFSLWKYKRHDRRFCVHSTIKNILKGWAMHSEKPDREDRDAQRQDYSHTHCSTHSDSPVWSEIKQQI